MDKFSVSAKLNYCNLKVECEAKVPSGSALKRVDLVLKMKSKWVSTFQRF
jgi:hypothetical protein